MEMKYYENNRMYCTIPGAGPKRGVGVGFVDLDRQGRPILEEGEFYPADESLSLGLVDRVLPRDDVREAAIAEAARLGALPAAAFALIKAERTREIAAFVERRSAEMEDDFLDGWFSPAARTQLEAAMEKY